jgi:peptidoglycan/xylan/chitin deacetylase (PgdA/CDA1 family)
MYHVIHPPPAGTPYPELWVAPDRFAEEMRALRDEGYRAVTLGQILDAWQGGPGLPARPVVVSFDDGYLSQYRDAGRTLRALGWPGVLNLEVKNLGLAGGLTRREVRAMARDGWEVGAHTITHPDLTTLDAAGLRREIAGSRSRLHAALGLPIDVFCYPAGRFDATVEAAVRDAGYRAATTTEEGLARREGDPYALPRLRVNGQDTAASLLSRLHSLG